MKVAIFGQAFYPDSAKYLNQIINVFQKKKINFLFEKEYLDLILKNHFLDDPNGFETFETIDSTFDLFFSLGGDGTILSSVKFVKTVDIPIVGINTGRLGFLATIHKDEVSSSINDILNGDYSISERSLLEVKSTDQKFNAQKFNYALNEVTISRKDTTSMISIDTWIDDEHIGAYWSDGLIIATPTGSTGYSLSCGGPIITPQTKSFVLSPIAPHNLSARPLVVPDKTEVKLKISGRENIFLISMDSRINTLSQDHDILIKKADFNIKLVSHKDNSFLKTLRSKLLWGKDQRN
ncbi:NAD kinase [Mesohalobacter halotolerans]|uniref:NAD kinase n=1 Tax=Mesohalobacter halotolerans TaxID=1883405 RepID=A0A4U5TNF2_9FLAO|nr:NAD kinase [Mesohalobacter halotolerans]TKS55460.1 NAD kinase [Mesohalobacter halotolerans]